MKRFFIFCVFFIWVLCPNVAADPFLPQWEWHEPKLYGKVKIIMKEEAIYNVKQIFNDQGRKIEEQLLNQGQIIYKTIFNYDSEGKLFSIERYSAQGNLMVRNTARYEKGFLKFMESSEQPAKGKFLYDGRGLLDEIIVSNANEQRLGKYVFRFNEYGYLVEKQRLNALLEKREKKVFFYNDKGHPVGELTFNPEGEMIRKDIYSYEYDSRGNWIVKEAQSEVFIGEEKGKISPIVERRKFTYFNM